MVCPNPFKASALLCSPFAQLSQKRCHKASGGHSQGPSQRHQLGVQRQLSPVSYFLELDHLEAPWQAVRTHHCPQGRSQSQPLEVGGGVLKDSNNSEPKCKATKEKLRLISG